MISHFKNLAIAKEHWSFNEQPLDFFLLSDIEKTHIKTKQAVYNQLAYTVLLKYFECEGRFPDNKEPIDSAIKMFLAGQLDIPYEENKLPNRTLYRFYPKIRSFWGYRKIIGQDKKDLSAWIKTEILPQGFKDDQIASMAILFCRQRKIELFAKNEMIRFLASLQTTFENDLFEIITTTLSDETKKLLETLLTEEQTEEEQKFTLDHLRKDTSQLKRGSILYEIKKYEFLKTLQIPSKIMDNYSRPLLIKYTRRIKTSQPSQISRYAPNTRYAQLAMFCEMKSQQSADILTDLLLKILNRIKKKAERRTEKYAISAVKRVGGKFDTLLQLAEVSEKNPKGVIEEVIYPKVSKARLHSIVQDLNCRGKWYQNYVQQQSVSLYTHGNRKLLLAILKTLTFETDNEDSKELLSAVHWILLDPEERAKVFMPCETQVLKSMGTLFKKTTTKWKEAQINLNAYELSILTSFVTELSVKNIWVKGAHKYQNPMKDLPADFHDNKAAYCELLDLPERADVFIDELKKDLEKHLRALNETILTNKKVKITTRKNRAIKITPPGPQKRPSNLKFLHQEISRLWPSLPLIDVLKEVDFRVGFTKELIGDDLRTSIPSSTLQKRLLLCLYALGSNTGLKSVITPDTEESYADLCYVKNRYLYPDAIRAAIQTVVNGVLAIRDPKVWGTGLFGCAGDSKLVNVWDQNLMSEDNGRYRAKGVMIYWHTDTKAMAIYSQLKTCSTSEVAAMMQGVLHHDTEMDMNEMFVDTHGQSSIGFAFSHLLHFDLSPRIKAINKQKLFLPNKALFKELENLTLALSKQTIKWKHIENHYDLSLHYTAALRTHTVEPDILLKRLSAKNDKHPGYKALMEIGKAKRTIFLCRYLTDEKFRIRINEALNMVERLNALMEYISHGNQGEIASNDKHNQELAILCLHLIQVCIVYINTLLIQEALSDTDRTYTLTNEDLRALTPIIHEHFNRYGVISLDMTKRILIHREKIGAAA